MTNEWTNFIDLNVDAYNISVWHYNILIEVWNTIKYVCII